LRISTSLHMAKLKSANKHELLLRRIISQLSNE
jgi:hypothetical protein